MRITTGVLVALALYVIFAYVLANTAWGRHVYATGDDREAARLAGIDVNRVLVSVYVVAGLVYAVGGWVQLGRSLSASSNAGDRHQPRDDHRRRDRRHQPLRRPRPIWGTLVGALIVTVFRIGLSSPASTRTTRTSRSAR